MIGGGGYNTQTSRQKRNHAIVFSLAALVVLAGLLTLIEYVTGWDMRIDQFLFREEAGTVAASNPGRMAPSTALNFVIVGLSLLLMGMTNRRYQKPAQYLMLVSGVLPASALISYLYGADQFYGLVAAQTHMAINTAVNFVLVFLGFYLARTENGIMPFITGQYPGSSLFRLLAPPAFVLFVLSGWLSLVSERAGFLDIQTSIALSVTLTLIIFILAIVFFSRRLNQKELEHQKAGEKIRRQNSELNELNKEIATFSYSVSHDLRSPLRGIDGFSQALLAEYAAKLDDQGKHYLDRVRAATQLMGTLIDDLLSLSRVTSKKMNLETINLSDMARQIARELQKEHPERQTEWVIGDGITARGDNGLMAIAMTNLLNNAWKYTGKLPEARIEFGLARAEDEAVYFVKDNGAGFDMLYKDKLFGPFQRLHTATDFPGNGIGLATVKRVIHRHGGRVWAEGAVNKGAAFYFTLNDDRG